MVPGRMVATNGVAAHPAFTQKRPGKEHWIEHSLRLAVDPSSAYELFADTSLWPVLFEPIIRVQTLDHHLRGEEVDASRLLIQFQVGGAVHQMFVLRRLDPRRLSVDLHLESPITHLASWSSRWSFQPQGRATRAVVASRFVPAATSLRSIDRTFWGVDDHDRRALRSLRQVTAGPPLPRQLIVRQEDAVTVAIDSLPGRRPEYPYNLVARADRWPGLLPYVDDVKLTMSIRGVHDLTLTTRTPDGSIHRSRCTRLVEWGSRIVYKHFELPAGLLGHSGEWTFTTDEDGKEITLTSRQVALLDPAFVDSVLFADRARTHLTAALSAHGRSILSHAIGGGAGLVSGGP